MKPPPLSCDTFVAVGIPLNPSSHVSNAEDIAQEYITVFGKNSDRPNDETHEVVYFPRKSYDDEGVVKCQYISIPQVMNTYSVVLSRPCWLWGCEMGANEWGLCAGNEAVWTREDHKCDDGIERLIGNVLWYRLLRF